MSFLALASLLVLHAAPVPRGDEPLEVVTTLGVLASLAREVGGTHVHAEALADPRQDPHYVEPKPTLMQKARAADLFVEVGLQLELWGEKVASGSGNPRIQTGQPGRVIASAGPGPLIGRGEQSIDFRTGEKLDQGPRETLAGNGQHTLDLCGVVGGFERGVPKEGVERCEAQIAAADSQAVLLQPIQKGHDLGRVNLLEVQR